MRRKNGLRFHLQVLYIVPCFSFAMKKKMPSWILLMECFFFSSSLPSALRIFSRNLSSLWALQHPSLTCARNKGMIKKKKIEEKSEKETMWIFESNLNTFYVIAYSKDIPRVKREYIKSHKKIRYTDALMVLSVIKAFPF